MATNYANAQYQEIVDLHTESDKVSIIGLHTPTGSKPRAMLSGFFTQFRKYKYKGCSLVMVPAARLPADPLGVSYEAGEPGSDPRDLLNPILFHGCHGDNLDAALDSIYKGTGFDYASTSLEMDEYTKTVVPADSLDWEAHYYRALSDPSFQKSNVMSPFRKKGLHPLVYNVASDHQIVPNQRGGPNVGKLVPDDDGNLNIDAATYGNVMDGAGSFEELPIHFMTNRLQSLGWIDTMQVINSSGVDGNPRPAELPKIFMGLIMLPPAYKTEMYFRLVLTHYFEFKEFNTSLSNPGAVDYNAWNMITTANAINEKASGESSSLDLVNSSAKVATEGVF